MSNMDFTSVPVASATDSFSLLLHGDFIPAPQAVDHSFPPGGGDGPFVRLTISVHFPRWLPLPLHSPSPTIIHRFIEYRFPTIEFPLSLPPTELRQLICTVFSHDSRWSVTDEDDETFEFLADQVTSFVNGPMVEQFPVNEGERALYLVRAFVVVDEEAPPAWIPPEATEAVATTSTSTSTASTDDDDLAGLLRKVAYKRRRRKEAAEDQVPETACPICLKDFEEDEEVHLTPCRHPFHLTCLARWLQTKAECPLCRSALRTDRSDDD